MLSARPFKKTIPVIRRRFLHIETAVFIEIFRQLKLKSKFGLLKRGIAVRDNRGQQRDQKRERKENCCQAIPSERASLAFLSGLYSGERDVLQG